MTASRQRLLVITDTTQCGRPLVDQIKLALQGGPFNVLLRDKHLPWDARQDLAAQLTPLMVAHDAQLIVSDPPEQCEAVHLSASAQRPRRRPALLGRSVHPGEVVDVSLDYVTYSPVYPTASKPGYGPAVGLRGLREFCREYPIPVVALGGITGPQQARDCRRAGAWGVAVMGAVMSANEPHTVVAGLREAIESR
ncbi:thiamine phosphate synthase [Natronoglycomyces albus]|uniref:Thiamine phosphate synthase n=1 Tax=Natronoglycomyces albus TaxID=2811108 RepID=A0A895XP86_9ACTN|nr:thiamine phosphate synthase [Natronoglycomyces albus]QSB04326.1 thiamine phosphate synthase [Natronoglycomyces albus]